MFHRFLICLFMLPLTGVFGDDVKIVMEGNYVTLHTNHTIDRDYEIEWWFVTQGFNSRIARIYNETFIYDDDVLDGRFRDRLQMDYYTGDLNITNIRTHHSGLYQMIINGGDYTEELLSRYHVIVYGHLPIPVISSYCLENPPSLERSSVSKCVLFCSGLNVRDVRDAREVSLSWYKGNSLLSSISKSKHHPFSNFLPLEVEYQDSNTYSCVAKDPISNQTQQLNITDVCQSCSDSVNSCATTEAVIRLVVSALVGVAAVTASVVLIYDIRSRRDEQKRRS